MNNSATYSAEEHSAIWSRFEASVSTERRALLALFESGRPDTLSWCDVELWIDQTHRVAVPVREAALAPAGATSLRTDHPKESSLLEEYGGGDGWLSSREILRWVAAMISAQSFGFDSNLVAHLFNKLVIQPLVNPSFEPLFWLAMANDLAANFQSNNLLADLRSLTFDMSNWPISRKKAPAVRVAQIRFVEILEPGAAGEGAESAADDEWTRRCVALLDARRPWVNDWVLDQAGWVR